jgi:hypothetical protein
MAGPYQQYSDPQLSQSNYSEPDPGQPYPAAASVYPGMLPPPVPYPSRRRWRLIAAILLVVVVLVAASTAIVYSVSAGSGSSSRVGGQLSEASAKAAIQNYLDAMLKGNTETVARNSLCGLYDSIKDRRSDQALARLSSETFRKQFSQVNVTSIDKMVFLSTYQAQVLFSMQVVPLARGSKQHEEQAVAGLLSQDGNVLVCTYLPRSGGQY